MSMQLTIITINYNNAAGLKKTIESVLAQTSTEFEYIVIDGSSTDGSVKTIQQINQSTNQPFIWLSEPDSGIYNAMNKGIRMAKGEYIHFLNSGDWLVDERVVDKMLKQITNQEQRAKNKEQRNKNVDSFSTLSGESEGALDILVGNVIAIRPDGKVLYKKNNNNPVSLYTFYRGTIEHTSAYIRRALFDKCCLYDESLKIVSDWKWYLQIAGLNHANVQFTDIYVTYFDSTGISSTNLKLDKEERRKVLEDLVPAPILADYDNFHFDIDQMQRLKKYPLIYRGVWLTERLLFKYEKWKLKYLSWKTV